MSTEKSKLSLLEMAHQAERCFPGPNNRVQVNHSGKPDAFQYAVDFFGDRQFKREFVDLLFSKEGVWHYQYQGEEELQKLDLVRLNKAIAQTVHEIYELANGSLDKISDFGFNRHDEDHVNNVMQGALQAMGPYLDAKYNEVLDCHDSAARRLKMEEFSSILFELICIVRGHDLGNILSRSLHSMISPNMFESIFPGLLQGKMRRSVRRGMMMHNEPVALATIESWGCQDLESTIQMMSQKMDACTLSTIAGDKIDIGRGRITYKMHTPTSEAQDKHLQVNLYLENQGLKFSEDLTEVTWSLDFTPTLSQEEQAQLAPYSVQAGDENNPRYKAWVSDDVHRNHRENHISHADYAESLLWSLYWPRTKLTIMSMFALYPSLKRFKISIQDKNTMDEEGSVFSETVTTFRRSQLESDFALCEKKYSLRKKSAAADPRTKRTTETNAVVESQQTEVR